MMLLNYFIRKSTVQMLQKIPKSIVKSSAFTIFRGGEIVSDGLFIARTNGSKSQPI